MNQKERLKRKVLKTFEREWKVKLKKGSFTTSNGLPLLQWIEKVLDATARVEREETLKEIVAMAKNARRTVHGAGNGRRVFEQFIAVLQKKT